MGRQLGRQQHVEAHESRLVDVGLRACQEAARPAHHHGELVLLHAHVARPDRLPRLASLGASQHHHARRRRHLARAVAAVGTVGTREGEAVRHGKKDLLIKLWWCHRRRPVRPVRLAHLACRWPPLGIERSLRARLRRACRPNALESDDGAKREVSLSR